MHDEALTPDQGSAETSEGLRIGRELIKATVPFAEGSVWLSWWHVGSTFAMLLLTLTGAGLTHWWPLRLLLSLLAAMLMVRAFIAYHDYMHRAILARSRVAWLLFRVYSDLALTPPRSWKKSHNYHHGHVGQVSSSGIGAFPIMTTQMWQEASRSARTRYRLTRHPLTVVAGYVTIFFFSVTLLPLLRIPNRHWDSLLVLVGHSALLSVLWIAGGFDTQPSRHSRTLPELPLG